VRAPFHMCQNPSEYCARTLLPQKNNVRPMPRLLVTSRLLLCMLGPLPVLGKPDLPTATWSPFHRVDGTGRTDLTRANFIICKADSVCSAASPPSETLEGVADTLEGVLLQAKREQMFIEV
jgi:hypothetical protein